MFGAYVRENRKVVIALAVYTAVFALIFWLYRLPLGAVKYAALVCLFLLLVWFAVDYRRFAARPKQPAFSSLHTSREVHRQLLHWKNQSQHPLLPYIRSETQKPDNHFSARFSYQYPQR